MKRIEFFKLQASGNDFILLDNRKVKLKSQDLKKLAKDYCQRKLGIGADGLLVVEPAKKHNFKMRIFNSDGSEAEMCGNGARCIGFWAGRSGKTIKFETKAGLIEARVKSQSLKGGNCRQVRIKLTDPLGIKLDLPINVLKRKMKVNFINTGVPHVVIFVDDLDNIDIEGIGRAVRFHNKFKPAGTNVNFVEFVDKNSIRVRTYERGVEAETLACGTGAIASAIIAICKLQILGVRPKGFMNVGVRQGDLLKVYYASKGKLFSNVWLEGKVCLLYKGMIGG